ncbi:MAG: hypothetical protein ABIQ95_05680 [Bdellovibrionia bacterium]
MKILILNAAILFLSLNLIGCASMARQNKELSEVSSGLIGCLPRDIVITDYENSKIETWRAACSASNFICNRKKGTTTKNYMTDDVINCAPEKPAI